MTHEKHVAPDPHDEEDAIQAILDGPGTAEERADRVWALLWPDVPVPHGIEQLAQTVTDEELEGIAQIAKQMAAEDAARRQQQRMRRTRQQRSGPATGQGQQQQQQQE